MDIIFLAAGGLAVWLGAEGMVKGAVKLAAFFGVSSLVIGLTVIAFGTSAPELVVSSIAAFQGYNKIAAGNVIGSNIINITLVLGLSAIIAPVVIDKKILTKDLPIVAAITVLVVLMAIWGSIISRLDGIILLIIFAAYSVYNSISAYRDNQRQTSMPGWERPELKIKHIVYLIGGTVLLAAGAHGMVKGAVGLARAMGISEQIVAMTIVAFGTSVPELAASVVAARHGESNLAVGNVIGSNLYNMTLILGTAAVISPIPLTVQRDSWDILFFVLAVFILFPLMRIKWRIGKIDGLLLLMFYILSVFMLFA
jgi:cation:H+ antiporter